MVHVFRTVVLHIEVLLPNTARLRAGVKLCLYMFRYMIPVKFQGQNILLSTSGHENNYIN